MPRGNPKPETIYSMKSHKKAGYRTKGFNLKGDTIDRFAEACEKVGVSQASKITELMEQFIKDVEEM